MIIDDWAPTYPQTLRQGGLTTTQRTDYYIPFPKDGYPTAHKYTVKEYPFTGGLY